MSPRTTSNVVTRACQATTLSSMAHIRQTRPDSGLGFEGKLLNLLCTEAETLILTTPHMTSNVAIRACQAKTLPFFFFNTLQPRID